MAAGLGSRFKGQKQVTPVDDAGHLIIDYTIYDARRAGFDTVIFVIKEDMRDAFHEAIGRRIERDIHIKYVYQHMDDIPEGIEIPEGRIKPWGTAHATLAARHEVNGPFAVVNADDFYGRSAFQSIYDFLSGSDGVTGHAMVGYCIENTLTENGTVSRGVCAVNGENCLTDIIERVTISARPGGAAYTEDDWQNEVFIPEGTQVSMNMWGFGLGMMREIEKRFKPFMLENLQKNPLKCEYFLPYVPGQMIHEENTKVFVLPSRDRWYGVTYPDDLPVVREAIARMKREGIYPEKLWHEHGQSNDLMV